jgi:surface protein
MSEGKRKPPARRTKRAKIEASPPPATICFQGLPGEIKKQFFGFLDVKTLSIQREVSREWKQSCEQAIQDKQIDGAGVFTTNEELRQAVNKYYKCKYEEYDDELAEKVAQEHGWVIGRWNVSAVTDFSEVFFEKRRFNEAVGDWAVGSGTNFRYMFAGCSAFNQDLSRWSMTYAVDLYGMFIYCTSFNQDLPWDTSNVTRIALIFEGATAFDGDVSSWNTSNITNIGCAFAGASSFNGDVSGWDVSRCTNMYALFMHATAFNKNLSRWTVSNVVTMESMFHGASSFCQDLSAWDISNVERMNHIFANSGVTRPQFDSWEGWQARVQELEHFYFDDNDEEASESDLGSNSD